MTIISTQGTAGDLQGLEDEKKGINGQIITKGERMSVTKGRETKEET